MITLSVEDVTDTAFRIEEQYGEQRLGSFADFVADHFQYVLTETCGRSVFWAQLVGTSAFESAEWRNDLKVDDRDLRAASSYAILAAKMRPTHLPYPKD